MDGRMSRSVTNGDGRVRAEHSIKKGVWRTVKNPVCLKDRGCIQMIERLSCRKGRSGCTVVLPVSEDLIVPNYLMSKCD